MKRSKGRGGTCDSAQTEAAFSAQLIKHNIEVALLAAALGVTFGIGTALLLFENGVLLGAVAVHYTQQGFGLFMTAWLLPHGVFEIPSILIAGQAGFYLARLLLRRREDRNVRQSMREWLVLVAGLAMMLVWAGLMEAFFSQHHAPVLPYGFKVAVAVAELVLLTIYLLMIGRREIGTEAIPMFFGEQMTETRPNPRVDRGRTDHCDPGRRVIPLASGRTRFPALRDAARYRDRVGHGERSGTDGLLDFLKSARIWIHGHHARGVRDRVCL